MNQYHEDIKLQKKEKKKEYEIYKKQHNKKY